MASQSADGAQSNNAPPPFLTKTYDMVDDPATDPIVSWSSSNSSFVVWNHSEFARDLLPKYFKHNNFSSFVRQLNTYGFRKVDPDRWEFANEGFARGKRHLLKNIHRRKPSHSHSQQQQQAQSSTLGCVEVGKYGLDGEIERLKRDKNTLMMELVKLQQHQQATERELQTLGSRLQSMEQRQQQMMTFLAKAMQNPEFLSQIVQQNENNMRLTAAKKKRRLPEEQEKSVKEPNDSDGQIVKYQPSNNDANNSVFMQLSHSDMLSKQELPHSPLESFLRDLAHFPVEQVDGGNPANHPSGVTLTEMNPSAIFPDALVGDIPGQSDLSLPDSPLAFPEADEVGDSGSGDFKVSEYMGQKADNPEVSEGKVESMVLDPNLNERAKLSSANEANANEDVRALVSNKNDVFWEQFLTESPSGSTDTDTEVATENLENVHPHEIFGGRWWINRSNVDQLTEQMGQLVSASRH